MSVPRYTKEVGHHHRYSSATVDKLVKGAWKYHFGFDFPDARCFTAQLVQGQRSPSGFRHPTGWSCYQSQLRLFPCELSVNYQGTLRYNEGYYYSVMNDPWRAGTASNSYGPLIPANMKDRARTEALNKFKNGDLNVGMALAESKQTLGFIASATTRAVTALRSARRGRWKQFGEALGFKGFSDSKGVSNGWLEYQYALTPLLSDIYAAQELFKDGLNKRDQLLKASRQITSEYGPSDWSIYMPLQDVYKCRIKQTFKTVMWAKVDNPFLHHASSLGLTNPALIAWELVPFSFVIDWFLPIGNFLEAATSTQGLTFVSGYEVSLHDVEVDATWRPSGTTLPADPSKRARFHVQQYGFKRDRLTSFPWVLPYYKSPFSTSHVLSAIALVRGFFKR